MSAGRLCRGPVSRELIQFKYLEQWWGEVCRTCNEVRVAISQLTPHYFPQACSDYLQTSILIQSTLQYWVRPTVPINLLKLPINNIVIYYKNFVKVGHIYFVQLSVKKFVLFHVSQYNTSSFWYLISILLKVQVMLLISFEVCLLQSKILPVKKSYLHI